MDLRVKQFSKIRTFPRPGDRIRALVERVPQAEELAERTAEKFRPALSWFFSARRRLATAGVCILTAWMFVHIVFGSMAWSCIGRSMPNTRPWKRTLVVFRKRTNNTQNKLRN